MDSNYREVTDSDWRRTILYIVSFSVIIVAVSFVLLPENWYLWGLIVALGTFQLISWHAKNFAYRCPNCGEVFEISPAADFLGPNGGTKKYLKCPNCSKRSWARILAKSK
ncbi:hypothetical protein [Methanolobus sp.]|uniref:hypothetical protein n=1 Tax=Methanolobus sp. TaxID=1874737 RepID=UPI0025EDA085|nr:hypothetical protein [Methanolobus sp.]